jgi:hypothetical protein
MNIQRTIAPRLAPANTDRAARISDITTQEKAHLILLCS